MSEVGTVNYYKNLLEISERENDKKFATINELEKLLEKADIALTTSEQNYSRLQNWVDDFRSEVADATFGKGWGGGKTQGEILGQIKKRALVK